MADLEELLGTSPEAVVVADSSGEIVRCNRHVEDVLGYAPEDLRGRAVATFLEEPDRDADRRHREDYLPEPEPRQIGTDLDLHARRADGSTIPVEVSLGPIEIDGETHVIGTVTDVAERESRIASLGESEARYRRLLDVSPAPIVIYDADGVIRYANEAAADLVDLADPADLVGRATTEFIHPQERAASAAAAERILADRDPVRNVERRIVTTDGETRHVSLSAVPITYEDDPGGQVLLSDVTPLVERECDLERQNERLEEFASIVSHDLRNPLTVLQSSLDLAKETGDQEHFDRADRAIDRMTELIDDLLSLARHGWTPEATVPVDVGEAAREAWATVETAEADLAVDADLTVEADPAWLRELLENLFRNAVEHGGETGEATVRVVETDRGFAIDDDGQGLPAEPERVLEHGFSTQKDGTGFGLAIVSEIAEGHGWSVDLGESPAGGARIEIRTA